MDPDDDSALDAAIVARLVQITEAELGACDLENDPPEDIARRVVTRILRHVFRGGEGEQ